MPYLKCEACRVRVPHVQQSPGLIDACPMCGRPLESADRLSEVMGFASVERPVDGAPSPNHGLLAAAVAEVIARRRAAERRARRRTP